MVASRENIAHALADFRPGIIAIYDIGPHLKLITAPSMFLNSLLSQKLIIVDIRHSCCHRPSPNSLYHGAPICHPCPRMDTCASLLYVWRIPHGRRPHRHCKWWIRRRRVHDRYQRRPRFRHEQDSRYAYAYSDEWRKRVYNSPQTSSTLWRSHRLAEGL